MIVAQEFAGIPIALPGWTQVVAYVFLVLLAIALGLGIWRTIVKQRQNTLLGEVHAKVNILLLIVRGWQERYETDSEVSNEHYSTDEHEKVDP